MNPKVTILLNKTTSAIGASCPKAPLDVKENIKNRNWTIKNFGYCQLFKFKCAGGRTGDAWLHGGPIQD